MPVLGKWTVPVALIAGWGLLGVEALSRELGQVFGSSGMAVFAPLYALLVITCSIIYRKPHSDVPLLR